MGIVREEDSGGEGTGKDINDGEEEDGEAKELGGERGNGP